MKTTQMHATNTLLASLTCATPETSLLQASIEGLADLVQAKYAAIAMLDAKGDIAQFVHTGMSTAAVARIAHPPKGNGMFGAVLQENAVLRLQRMADDPRSGGFPAGHPPMTSLLAVPIAKSARMYGKIYLCDKLDTNDFSDEDEELALSFAHALARVVETGRELAALKQQQHQLVHSAFHDPLTGLPNRTLLCDRIGQVLNQAERNRHESALLFCDLDGFKFINDNMGHAAGDKVLQTVSERLLQCVRSEDTVARIGGDEFVVVLAHIESADHTRVVAQKILDALALELCVEGAEIALSGSVGIAVYPFDGESAERLIRNADAAMYRAKEGGKNHFRFYTETATTQADASRSIVHRVAPWHERTGNNRILQQYAI